MTPRATGKVLLVDDDPQLLRAMKAFLSRRGYEVETCRTHTEAWERFQAEPSGYLLMIVDMTADGMPAGELFAKALQANLQIGLVASSGYPVDLKKLPIPATASITFLEKPFTPKMLAETIERLLAR